MAHNILSGENNSSGFNDTSQEQTPIFSRQEALDRFGKFDQNMSHIFALLSSRKEGSTNAGQSGKAARTEISTSTTGGIDNCENGSPPILPAPYQDNLHQARASQFLLSLKEQ